MRALDVFKRRIARSVDKADNFYRVVGSKNATSNFVPVNYVADILALAATKAEAGKIYNITNPSPATNYNLLSLIKNALDFQQLEIIENAEPRNADSSHEERLNGMISVFNAYLSRSFDFDDSNTQQLIEGTLDIRHLDMDEQTTRLIIDAYFAVSE